MRVLQLVAADRWTGAAATALQLAEALRAAGHECVFAYRPGRNLEDRLRGFEWCRPALAKERTLADVRAAIARVRELAAGCDVVHANLPHDHLLARQALGGSAPPLVRGVHHLGHLRPDPYHRWLFRGAAGLGLANSAMLPARHRLPAVRDVPARVLPVALEDRFRPGAGRDATRERLGVPPEAVVAGTIGKLDRGRGHDLFIHALAAAPAVWGMIIGKGPYLDALHALARRLGVAGRLVFPGYAEAGLEDLYAAMDIFVFPAAGSDHAHRAIAEAAGCGVPALAADLPGVRDLVEPGVTGDVYPASDAAALAVLIAAWAGSPAIRGAAGSAAAARARARWTPAALAEAALALYGALSGGAAATP
ncbi:MAG: glycosyltransferase family 4 protein [Thermoanaerobaculaceae bacterium]|nr:glycosyltransferase family 4 protein [Thermoanaerobaculaceae bacterium]